jgi:hypothetical protein
LLGLRAMLMLMLLVLAALIVDDLLRTHTSPARNVVLARAVRRPRMLAAAPRARTRRA